MTRIQKLLAFLLILSLAGWAQKPSGRSCSGVPLLTLLSEGMGASLLGAYGYDLQQPWACTKIESPYASGAAILRFRKITAQTDDQTAFTVVKLPSVDYIWVIPTNAGMLEVPHAESDPHNIAAFNALLRLHKGAIHGGGWLEAGKLYMAILGHEQALPLKDEAGNLEPCASSNECSISFSDRPVIAAEAYNKWTLVFAVLSKGESAALIDVSKETVRPAK